MSRQDQPAKRLMDRSILFPRASDDDGTCHPVTGSFQWIDFKGNSVRDRLAPRPPDNLNRYTMGRCGSFFSFSFSFSLPTDLDRYVVPAYHGSHRPQLKSTRVGPERGSITKPTRLLDFAGFSDLLIVELIGRREKGGSRKERGERRGERREGDEDEGKGGRPICRLLAAPQEEREREREREGGRERETERERENR